MMRLLLGALFLEVGLVLAVVPWSAYWDRNYFADLLPFVDLLASNNFIRGAVSGLGLVNVAAGVAEVVSVLAARRVQPSVISLRSSSALED